MVHEIKTLAGALTKNEFAKRFKTICPIDLNMEQSKTIVDSVFQTIHDSLLNGDSVTMFDVGSLNSLDRQERTARNPMTGEDVIVAPNMHCKFRISPKLKKELKAINPNKRKNKKFY